MFLISTCMYLVRVTSISPLGEHSLVQRMEVRAGSWERWMEKGRERKEGERKEGEEGGRGRRERWMERGRERKEGERKEGEMGGRRANKLYAYKVKCVSAHLLCMASSRSWCLLVARIMIPSYCSICMM